MDREIRNALKATGLPWSIEPGHKHNLIRLNGKLIGIFSRGGSACGRDWKKIKAAIRHAMVAA